MRRRDCEQGESNQGAADIVHTANPLSWDITWIAIGHLAVSAPNAF